MFTKKDPSPKTVENPNKQSSTTSNSVAPKAQSCVPCTTEKNARETGKITRITIKYDTGFGNTLFLRGKGANLSWEKGIPLRNVKNDEWIWETDATFPNGEYKVLINDSIYETGQNHALYCGTITQHTPRF